MQNEIRYFSMFAGVGGFERGLKKANDLSKAQRNEPRRNEETSPSIEPELLASKQSISERTENNSTCRESKQNQDTGHKSYFEGIEQIGQCSTFTCVGQSEWDKYSSQVLRYRFPKIKNWGDCTKIKPEELPDFDMLCGGFPCQAFSIAGKRRGFEDTRGTMFFEVARIAKVKRPKLILLENVKGLLNHEGGKTYRVIIQALEELGYEFQWMVLNSKFHGVPQNRERVLIIGSLRGERRLEILPFGESCGKSYEEDTEICRCHSARYSKAGNGTHIQQLNNPTHSNNRIYGEEGISPALNTAQGGNRQPKIRAVLTPDRAEKRQNGRRFKEPGEPSFTVTGQDIHGVATETTIRRLTPIECERLQGFPDNWTEYGINEKGEKVKMSDTQRYKQMGNAVTTNVIAVIGLQILKTTLEKDGN